MSKKHIIMIFLVNVLGKKNVQFKSNFTFHWNIDKHSDKIQNGKLRLCDRKLTVHFCGSGERRLTGCAAIAAHEERQQDITIAGKLINLTSH